MAKHDDSNDTDDLDDFDDESLGMDDDIDMPLNNLSEKQQLAEKRRRAELRMEERRLREEIGYYDLSFDDL
ncbi:hypothetical protein IMCC3088_2145 [Aequoribacter fuscus]|jgi:hypothetical protein|uniref:Uncharacterized protein n=1 Tax=Aequoribacter fuscus TaxID=2518989 RepID=F3L3F3_9GAMM|nr:hypothetical protein [Aequoribacter fuscus]EGG29145.1 hypothetical protein IMCC3088_2145 [Aequoribacter fuscus]QHJ86857.1 hypothetical protein EYZ66_00415 [Aequoribacter fuscus]